MSDRSAAQPEDGGKVSIQDADFLGVTFTELANFEGVTFTKWANFEGTTFTGGGNFEGATFTKGANFRGSTSTEVTYLKGATFSGEGNFAGATFTGGISFEGATFIKRANFEGATFIGVGIFEGATFMEGANFRRSTFTGWANFEGVPFTKLANFEGATFIEWANFKGSTFTEWAKFEGVTFTKWADFEGVTFTEGVNFVDVTFDKWARFEGATFQNANFVNSEMKSETTFDNAFFLRTPPLFDGAKLHEGTTWFGVTWPPSPRTKEDARITVRAYERLKLEMDRLKKHEDELNFFALELQARRVLVGKWRTFQGLAIGLYECLGDYGRSYSRPLWLLGAVTALGAVPFLVHSGLPGWRGSLAISGANTFGILGLRREFFPPSVIIDLPWMLKLLSAVQTVAGAVLFFLFGLGLRNRFRLK